MNQWQSNKTEETNISFTSSLHSLLLLPLIGIQGYKAFNCRGQVSLLCTMKGDQAGFLLLRISSGNGREHLSRSDEK